ncbi:MAG: pyridoxal phosphate-dependent aminotransferase [Candidatus Bipolaricaulota bacterium]|nr:pyridoxal phosphate-dependent aminotransferase [Candidatus Bipolaricaulota bacterium]MDW8126606.1 pyridoxal phosphate-dependent aminotransferase [Candidatus Bipolaricaulota bacterium]
MPNISARSQAAPASPIRRLYPLAVEAKRKGKRVYHLNIGQPDIPTPEAFLRGIREAKVEVLDYAPSPGRPEAIHAVQAYYAELGFHLTPQEILITIGGSEAITFALMVTCDPGDRVLIPEPFYPNYLGYARLANVEITPLTTFRSEGFHLPPRREIERHLTPNTKAILLSNPANPTGVVYTEAELDMLVALALQYDLFLIVDEVYREFVYDGKHKSILSYPEIAGQAIVVDSISKRLSACGARIGMLISRNKEVMAAAQKCATIRLSAPTFEQLGFAAFMADPNHRDIIARMIEEYRVRRDTFCEELAKIPGVTFRKPEGAFYVMFGLPVQDSEDFIRWMLTDFPGPETVMFAPGAGFYATPGKGQDEVRGAYVLNTEDLRRACAILAEGLTLYTAALARARG